jgi:hypothetical protein
MEGPPPCTRTPVKVAILLSTQTSISRTAVAILLALHDIMYMEPSDLLEIIVASWLT